MKRDILILAAAGLFAFFGVGTLIFDVIMNANRQQRRRWS